MRVKLLRPNLVVATIFLIITFATVWWFLESSHLYKTMMWRTPKSTCISKSITADSKVINKMTVATVACRKEAKDNTVYHQAIVMIKSALISAILHGVKNLDIFIFLEDIKGSEFFNNKLIDEFGLPYRDIKVTTHFLSAIDAVPKEYRESMIYNNSCLCSYVKLFFPASLRKVDHVLYLDTDVIVTGNIARLWLILNIMDESQLLSMGYNYQKEDTNYGWIDEKLFRDIPHLPQGLNTGVILMNLKKMRDFGWEGNMLSLYDAFVNDTRDLTDQRLLNILLFYNPGLLCIFNCKFNFRHTHCDKGLTCKPVIYDPVGIHLVHGANKKFQKDGVFSTIFDTFEKFNMITGDVVEDLMVPIKNYYKNGTNSSNQCYESLSNNLFKSI